MTHKGIIILIMAYTVLGAFVFTVVITCLSVVGWITFADKRQQRKLFYAVLVELAVGCVGLSFGFLSFDPRPVAENITLETYREVSLAKRFDTVVEGVEMQSDALIRAAETIKEHAEARIAETERQSLSRLESLAVDTIPSLPAEERKKAAEQMIEMAAKTTQAAASARKGLAEDLAAIQANTQELEAYMAKMKEVQVALDAYLQSGQARDRARMQALLVEADAIQADAIQADAILAKVTESINTVKTLLSGLDTGR